MNLKRKRRLAAGLASLMALAMLFAPLADGRALADKGTPPLRAAFVRGGDLWVKEDAKEKRLTRGEQARNPRWSPGGQWLAYTAGEQERELRIVRADGTGEQAVAKGDIGDYRWSPTRDRLAFLSGGGKLAWIDAAKPGQPVQAAADVSGFGWQPDGEGFAISTQAHLQPDGTWSQVSIARLKANGSSRYTLYTLPKQSDDFFAVGTGAIKWSADGRWLAFVATPTASLSADANTLCVLSADGSTFQRADTMLNHESWFQWAARGSRLAYIAGEGREATTNKRLETADVPLGKPSAYTPAGHVDQGFVWKGTDRIVVSRAKERKEWTGDPSARPLPWLAEIDLNGRVQTRLTPAMPAHGDYNPVYLPRHHKLAWVRTDRKSANVMLGDEDASNARVWIKGIDLGDNFYEAWDWGATLRIEEGGERAADR